MDTGITRRERRALRKRRRQMRARLLAVTAVTVVITHLAGGPVGASTAPDVSAPGTIAVTEDTASNLAGISFTDDDVTPVTVDLSVTAGTITAPSSGGVTSLGSGTAAVTLTGTVADLNTYFAAPIPQYTTDTDSTTDETLSVTITDGDPQSDLATITLDVTAMNDAPSASAPASFAVTEDTAAALTGISFGDVDAGAGSVTATFSVATGSMAATSGGGVTVGGTASALTLSGTLDDINAFIAGSGLSFTPASDSTADETLAIGINDGGNSGLDPGLSGNGTSEANATSANLDVSAVNDAPAITVPVSITVVEDTATPLVGVSVNDVDGGSASMTVVLSVPTGALSASSFGGVSVAGSGTTTLSLTGTLADINAFIAASRASYTTASDSLSDVTLTVSVDDGGNTGADPGLTGTGSSEADSDTTTLTVTASNDGPFIAAPASIGVTEDTAGAITGISFSDVDAASGTATATFSAPSGSLAATSGGGVTVGGTYSARTLSGTIADINTFIAGSNVTFTTATSATADVTLTVSIDDGGNTGVDPGLTGTGSSEAASTTVTITVSGVNDAPVTTVPASIAVTEEVASALTGISFADVDAGSASVTVVLTVPSGSLAATSGGGVTVGGTATARTLTGSVANINTFIAGSNVTFTSPTDALTDVTLTVTIDDGGNTGSDPGLTGTGSSEADSDTTTLTVTAVNDAPVLAVPGSIAITEDVAGAISGISASDVDVASGAVTATLSVPSGTLAATSGGGVTVGGSGTATLTLSGTLANVNAFIAGSNVTFTTALDASADVTLTVAIDDGGNTGLDPGATGTGSSEADSETVTLDVSAVNDEPSITAPGSIGVTEDTDTALVGISFADVDAGSSSVTTTFEVSAGVLLASSGGGVTVSGSGTDTVTLVGSIANINAFIAASNLQVSPPGDSTADITLDIDIDDEGNTGSGGNLTDSDSTTLSFDDVNDAPSITAPGSIAITEDVAGAVGGITFADVDAGSGSVTVTLSVPSGTLAATSGGGVTVGGTASARTLSGTIADINAFIAGSNVTFTTVSDASADVTLTVAIDDGGNTGTDPGLTGTGSSEADSDTVTLDVSAVNDAPTITAAASEAVAEDGTIPLDGFSFADVDAGSAVVDTSYTLDIGTLVASSGGGVTVSGSGTGTLGLQGTIANINAFVAAGNLDYVGYLDHNGTATFDMSIDDGGNVGSGGPQGDYAQTTINISAVNDAPVITAPPTFDVVEDVTTPLDSLGVADVDSASASVTVDLDVDSGELWATSGSGVTVGGSGSASMTLTGTVSAIDGFLGAGEVEFLTDANAIADVALTIGIDDGGSTGSGGTLTDSDAVTLEVTAVNDPPQAGDDSGVSYELDEDGILDVPAPGLLGNDTDIEGDPLSAELVTRPAHGEVVVDPDGAFTYTPDPDFNGVDTFAYQVDDGVDGGALGAEAHSLEAGPLATSGLATVTITVTSIPDSPRADDDSIVVREGQSTTINVLANDEEPDGETLSISAVSPPGAGSVSCSSNCTFVAPVDAPESTTFTYTLSDPNGLTDSATVTVLFTQVSPTPAELSLTGVEIATTVRRSLWLIAGGATLVIAAALLRRRRRSH